MAEQEQEQGAHPNEDAEQTAIPDTLAGRELAAYLAELNRDGDIAQLSEFFADHFAASALAQRSADQHAARAAALYSFTHGFELWRIEASTEQTVEALLQARLDGHWVRLGLELEHDPPHKITAIHLAPMSRPAERNVPGRLSEAQVVQALATHLDTLVGADVFSGAVLLAKDGVPIFTRAHGLASIAYQAPMRLDTKMNLGSMNKMFTAVAIVQLAEQGTLDFGDPIIAHLPDYPEAVAKKVTINQLLTHTAGLGSYWNDKFEAAKGRLRTVSDFLPLFIEDPLSFEPGEGWHIATPATSCSARSSRRAAAGATSTMCGSMCIGRRAWIIPMHTSWIVRPRTWRWAIPG